VVPRYIHQVEAAQHRAAVADQHVEVAPPGGLLGEQRGVPRCEAGEVVSPRSGTDRAK
jgi:hypothetical protein